MSILRKEIGHRMSKIVIHNETVYLSGQIPKDGTREIEEQTLSVLKKIESLLEQAGSDKQHLLSATIYISDMRLFSRMNEVWDNWVPEGHTPVRACVEAKMSKPSILVEISIIGAVKNI